MSNMIHTLIIFFLLLFFSTRKISFKSISPITLVGNIFFSFILFILFFDYFKTQLWSFFANGFDTFVFDEQSTQVSNNFQIFISLLFFLNSFFVTGLSISLLLRRDFGRVLLLKTLPVIWLITSSYLSIIVLIYNIKPEVKPIISILIISLFFASIFVPMYYIYGGKTFKKLFNPTDVEKSNN